MGKRYIIGAVAAATLALSGCNPLVDPAPGWGEASVVHVIEGPGVFPEVEPPAGPAGEPPGGQDSETPVDSRDALIAAVEEEISAYRFDSQAWSDSHRKSPAVIAAVLGPLPEPDDPGSSLETGLIRRTGDHSRYVPPERRAERIYAFLSAGDILETLGNMERWLVHMEENFPDRRPVSEQDCDDKEPFGRLFWFLNTSGQVMCKWFPTEDDITRHPVREHGIYLGSGSGMAALERAREMRAGLEELEGDEDTVEILLAEQLQQWFLENTGEALDSQIEFEDRSYGVFLMYDTETGEIFHSIYYVEPLAEGAAAAVEALFTDVLRYLYSTAGISGLSTDPVMVTASGFPSSIRVSGHEFMHHVLSRYPVGSIPGEDGSAIKETLADIYGWMAAKDLYEQHYRPLDAQLRYGGMLAGYVSPAGAYLNPDGEHFEATADAASDAFYSRYGSSAMSRRVVALYNCIADPRTAFGIFSQMDSADDVGEQLGLCQREKR